MTTTQRRGVAVVTGQTAGVGQAVVRWLAEKGFDLAIQAGERPAAEVVLGARNRQ